MDIEKGTATYGRFLRFVESRVGDRAVAEDILQDAFARNLDKAAALDDDAVIGGVSLKAYAAERGLTAGNAAVRVHRARRALKARLAETCGRCAEHGCVDCTCRHS